MDRFTVKTLAATSNPNQICWLAAHQDYSEEYVVTETPPDEAKAGGTVASICAKGHWGIVEHAFLTLACGYFPHETMVQARTHRHLTFDVQSLRYTSQRFIQAAEQERSIDEVFYFRTPGIYRDRQGHQYDYTLAKRIEDRYDCFMACQSYQRRIKEGCPPEVSRSLLPGNYRQHFVLSGSARALFHFIGVRGMRDAQPEIQVLSDLILQRLTEWMPELGNWFQWEHYRKNRLAP